MHEDAEPGMPRRTRLLVAAAAALGGAWRFGYVVVAKRHTSLMLNDSLYYSVQATQLAHGTWFRDVLGQMPAAEHGPLTPIVLAPLSRLGDPVLWQRLGNAALGTVTIVLIGVLAFRVAGSRPAVVAAFLAAISPNLWMNDVVVMSESVALLCVTLALLGVLAAIRRPSWRRQALAGVAIGLAALARSELVLLAALLAAVLIWANAGARGWRRVLPGVVLLTASLATLAPWTVYNLTRFERPVFLTTNDGTTLVGANCPEMYAGPDIGGWSLFCVFASLQPPVSGDDSVRAARQRSLAVHFAVDHLGRLPIVAVARLARTLDLWGHSNLVHQDVGEERAAWASWAGIVVWLATMPLLVVGLVALGRPERAVLAAPLVAVLVVAVATYGAHRIRSPAEPAAVVLAAAALCRLWPGWPRRVDPRSSMRAVDAVGGQHDGGLRTAGRKG